VEIQSAMRKLTTIWRWWKFNLRWEN